MGSILAFDTIPPDNTFCLSHFSFRSNASSLSDSRSNRFTTCNAQLPGCETGLPSQRRQQIALAFDKLGDDAVRETQFVSDGNLLPRVQQHHADAE